MTGNALNAAVRALSTSQTGGVIGVVPSNPANSQELVAGLRAVSPTLNTIAMLADISEAVAGVGSVARIMEGGLPPSIKGPQQPGRGGGR